jgi:hypothetical protein
MSTDVRRDPAIVFHRPSTRASASWALILMSIIVLSVVDHCGLATHKWGWRVSQEVKQLCRMAMRHTQRERKSSAQRKEWTLWRVSYQYLAIMLLEANLQCGPTSRSNEARATRRGAVKELQLRFKDIPRAMAR